MITTYTELKEAVADWLNRSDLTDVIPSFIANAEARLNKRVRHREMVATQAITLNASGEASLPSDYLEWRMLTLATTPASRPEFVEPDSREFLFRFRPFSVPQYFTILNATLKVQPAQAVSGTLYYYQKIPALSAVNTSNWLLDRSPDAYLYASLAEANIYLRDTEALEINAAVLDGAVAELINESRANRLARQPAAQPAPAAKTQEQA